MRKLLILLVLTACGGTYEVEVEDSKQTIEGIPERIEIIHSIDIGKFKEDIIEICELGNNTEEEIQECIDENVDNILEAIGELNNENL